MRLNLFALPNPYECHCYFHRAHWLGVWWPVWTRYELDSCPKHGGK